MPKSTRATPAELRYRALLEKQSESCLSHADFARKHGLKPQTLSWWKSEIRRRERSRGKTSVRPERRKIRPAGRITEEPVFLPVRVVEEMSEPRPVPAAYEVVLAGGRVLRVPRDFDRPSLTALVAALEGAPC